MHPSEVLFQGQRQPLLLPACDHYAGSEKLMRKSMALQQELGPIFDITFDCEDGASAGDERAHAELVASLINSDDNRYNRVGARLHDVGSPHFAQDVEIIVGAAAKRLAYVVLTSAGQKLVTNARATLERMAGELFKDRWTKQEIATLAELLGRLTIGLPGNLA